MIRAAEAPPDLSRTVWSGVALLTLCGAVLRLFTARGDLWLDEIWTFRLLEQARTPATILFGLPSDNNHVLNSLWLWLVGPHAAPMLVRLPAILTGSLCAPVAAWIVRREGRLAAMAAAVIFAFDYAFVHFGSEARGYSGLILAVLVALAALDAMLADGITPRRQAIFAAAVAFGTFSHLTMIEATIVLCIYGLGVRLCSLRQALSILLPAAFGTLPALLCLGLSLAAAPLHIGLATPFSLAAFMAGLSRMLGATLGLPDMMPGAGWLGLALLASGMGVIVAMAFIPTRRRLFYGLALFVVPVLHIVLRLPNQQFPRFHLLAAIALALLGVDAWTALRHRAPRLAIVIAALFLMGQTLSLIHFIGVGRGASTDAVHRMAQDGPTTFAAMPPIQASETRAVVRWYAGAAPVKPADVACGTLPDWLIVATMPYDRYPSAEAMAWGPDTCPARYGWQQTFAAYGLSGFTWTLYHRL